MAFIRFFTPQVWLIFEGGAYLRAVFLIKLDTIRMVFKVQFFRIKLTEVTY